MIHAWGGIHQTMTIATKCSSTLIGEAQIRVALMTVKSPTICWAITTISYPTQEKNAAKSFINGITIPVPGRDHSWHMGNTIPIGMGQVELVWMTTKCQNTFFTIKLTFYRSRLNDVARDSIIGRSTSVWALQL
jgi:hypothetical protein